MTITQIVNRLVGSIVPYGSSEIDKERAKNLEVMVELVNNLYDQIFEVSTMRFRPEHSIKEMGKTAHGLIQDRFTPQQLQQEQHLMNMYKKLLDAQTKISVDSKRAREDRENWIRDKAIITGKVELLKQILTIG